MNLHNTDTEGTTAEAAPPDRGQAGSVALQLVWQEQGKAPREFPLKGPLTIGRGADNDIVVDGPAISRRHVEIRPEGGGYLLANHGRNGTKLNGQPVEEPALLQQGDVIALNGLDGVTFKVTEFGATLALGLLKVDGGVHQAWLSGVDLSLTRQEFAALDLLYRTAFRLVTRTEMIRVLWPGELTEAGRQDSLNTLMSALRAKLDQVTLPPGRTCEISTVRGVGYMLIER